MSDYSTSAMIAYPTLSFDGQTAEPHSTIIFLGSIFDLHGKENKIRSIVEPVDMGWVRVEELDYFGLDSNIPVLKLENTLPLRIYREDLENKLEKIDVYTPSVFPYSPHVTVHDDPENFAEPFQIPAFIWLGKPKLYWGNRVIN